MADLIDRDSLLEKVQFRIEPKGVIGETVRDMVEKTREIIKAEPAVTDNNDGCKWIPVTERLPEASDYYLYKAKGMYRGLKDGVGVSYFMHKAKKWQKTNGDHVTHWMHLPEPPKEER